MYRRAESPSSSTMCEDQILSYRVWGPATAEKRDVLLLLERCLAEKEEGEKATVVSARQTAAKV